MACTMYMNAKNLLLYTSFLHCVSSVHLFHFFLYFTRNVFFFFVKARQYVSYPYHITARIGSFAQLRPFYTLQLSYPFPSDRVFCVTYIQHYVYFIYVYDSHNNNARFFIMFIIYYRVKSNVFCEFYTLFLQSKA